VLYLVLAKQNFSKQLAQSYLEEIRKEFDTLYDYQTVQKAERPYAFIRFGKITTTTSTTTTTTMFLQKKKNQTTVLTLPSFLFVFFYID
jgi:hypothetical protein